MRSDRQQSRSEVICRNGIVCSSQPLCSQVGIEVLKQGGTAVDAAIATNCALGLMEPMSCGVGGDLFAIIYSANEQRLYGLESVGRSPQNLNYERMTGVLRQKGLKKIPTYGVLSVSTPGCVAGWFEMHRRFGILPMSSLLSPTIGYAREGFPVSEIIANEWRIAESFQAIGGISDELLFEGVAPRKGNLFVNKYLAKTLERISENGQDGFYGGKTAFRIEQFLQSNGGFLTRQDLADHRAEWVAPISTNYRGYDVYQMPFPGQGTAVLQMLNILENFDLSNLPDDERIHLMIEAKKLAFEDRAKFYGDPRFGANLYQNKLISKAYGKECASLIKQNAAELVSRGNPQDTSETIYLTTADKDGNMVSLIQSIFHGFGSRIVVPKTGFCLQNRGTSFSLDQGHVNCYEAGKQPFHTIIPSFVTKNNVPFFSFGVMGGDMQPQGQVQILSNIIDRGMNAQAAGDMPRWRHFGSSEPTETNEEYLSDGGFVTIEKKLGEAVGNRLKLRGHKVVEREDFFGGYQGVLVKDGVYFGASESRKDGQACGF